MTDNEQALTNVPELTIDDLQHEQMLQAGDSEVFIFIIIVVMAALAGSISSRKKTTAVED